MILLDLVWKQKLDSNQDRVTWILNKTVIRANADIMKEMIKIFTGLESQHDDQDIRDKLFSVFWRVVLAKDIIQSNEGVFGKKKPGFTSKKALETRRAAVVGDFDPAAQGGFGSASAAPAGDVTESDEES
jgi:hypothetical protein